MTFDNVFLFRMDSGELMVVEVAKDEDVAALTCGKVFETIQVLNPYNIQAIPGERGGVQLGLVPLFFTMEPVVTFFDFKKVTVWAKAPDALASHYKTQVTGITLPTNGSIVSPDFNKGSKKKFQ